MYALAAEVHQVHLAADVENAGTGTCGGNDAQANEGAEWSGGSDGWRYDDGVRSILQRTGVASVEKLVVGLAGGRLDMEDD